MMHFSFSLFSCMQFIKCIECHGCLTGSFEREVLKHFDTIVEKALPLNKVTDYYKQSPGSGRQLILDFVTFFEEQKMVGGHIYRIYIEPILHFIFFVSLIPLSLGHLLTVSQLPFDECH